MKRSFIKVFAGFSLLLLSGIAVGIILFVSCDRAKHNTAEHTKQPGLPPSLSPVEERTFIHLSEKEVGELDIKTVVVKKDFKSFGIIAPAEISVAPGNAFVISAPIQGVVKKIYFAEGDAIDANDLIFQIESIEYGNLMADYLLAKATEEFENSQMLRIKQLVEKRIAPQNDLDRAQSELLRASAQARAIWSKLRAVGISSKEIDNLIMSEKIDPLLKINSPISGKIDHLQLEPGQAVDAYGFMARIVNSSKLLVTAYLSPADAALITIGDKMTLQLQGLNDTEISGKIHAINPGLDEISRSALVHAIISNPDNKLKPGERLRVTIETQTETEVLTIPLNAITYDGDFAIVFVKVSENVFEKRNISISDIRSNYILVESGLMPGEVIAVSQIFSLKALMRFDLFSE